MEVFQVGDHGAAVLAIRRRALAQRVPYTCARCGCAESQRNQCVEGVVSAGHGIYLRPAILNA